MVKCRVVTSLLAPLSWLSWLMSWVDRANVNCRQPSLTVLRAFTLLRVVCLSVFPDFVVYCPLQCLPQHLEPSGFHLAFSVWPIHLHLNSSSIQPSRTSTNQDFITWYKYPRAYPQMGFGFNTSFYFEHNAPLNMNVSKVWCVRWIAANVYW